MHRFRRRAAAAALFLALPLAACAGPEAPDTTTGDAASAAALWDRSRVHTIALTVDGDALAGALSDYAERQEKTWITADVTIDGVTFEDVGMKLKGNSSLRGISADSEPAELPWIIRLDKYVDGQSWDGQTELVVRGNSTATSLNEAVALTMLEETGLAAEAAIATSFSVNGSEATLRLTVQNPDEEWTEANFGADALLYKSEAEGTWDYVGDDPADYVDSFDQEAGAEDYAPLIDFLEFVNTADDATFAAELADRLDVDAFATYLAFQDLVGNTDDIDGPGNNSYLAWSGGRFTVVNWDLNLAFGQSPGGAGGGQRPGGGAGGGQRPDGANGPEGWTPPDGATGPDGAPDGMTRPEGVTPPDGAAPGSAGAEGAAPGAAAGGRGGASRGNILAERFRANADFAALVTAAHERLDAQFVAGGEGERIAQEWVDVLSSAEGLVPADEVTSDAATITAALTS